MTIKQFSKLCGCSAQTLRFYDSIDLLKPARVDENSGYRYYDEDQALMYVRIRALQEASFTNAEIKRMLGSTDDEVMEALSQKVKEQEAKLIKIKRIQMSYREETMKMRSSIREYCEEIRRLTNDIDPMAEFGIRREEYDAITEKLYGLTDKMLETAGAFAGVEAAVNATDMPEACGDVIYETSGWKYVKEALEGIPDPDGCTLEFIFGRDKPMNPALPMVVLALIHAGEGNKIECRCVKTDGEENCLKLIKSE